MSTWDRWTRTLVSADKLVHLCRRTRTWTRTSQIVKPRTWTRTRTSPNFESQTRTWKTSRSWTRTRTGLFQKIADTDIHRSLLSTPKYLADFLRQWTFLPKFRPEIGQFTILNGMGIYGVRFEWMVSLKVIKNLERDEIGGKPILVAGFRRFCRFYPI